MPDHILKIRDEEFTSAGDFFDKLKKEVIADRNGPSLPLIERFLSVVEVAKSDQEHLICTDLGKTKNDFTKWRVINDSGSSGFEISTKEIEQNGEKRIIAQIYVGGFENGLRSGHGVFNASYINGETSSYDGDWNSGNISSKKMVMTKVVFPEPNANVLDIPYPEVRQLIIPSSPASPASPASTRAAPLKPMRSIHNSQ